MGNQVLGKRPTDFVKGFDQAQVQYVKQKFEILKDTKGLLSEQKFMQAYRCPKQIASKAIKFIDFSQNGQIDQYQFICAVAALCNTSLSKLSQMLFQILTDRKDKLDQATLQTFTSITLTFNSSLLGQPDPSSKTISSVNTKKFKKWDYNSSGFLELQEFTKLCLVDKDYKQWMFNMGFINRRQLQNQQELYDEVDGDLEMEVRRHATEVDPDVDRIRKGVEHRIGEEKLGEFQVQRDDGDQSTPITRQWVNQVNYVGCPGQQSDQPPSQTLTLQYSYGYRSYDCRNNLKYNSKGKAIYHTGSLGVVLDCKQNKQDFMTSHNDDVTCLDISRDLVVTGEVGVRPVVVVWGSERQEGAGAGLRVEHVLVEGLEGGSVGNVAISGNRPYVAANCNNEDHNIVIYDLKLLKQSEKNPRSKQSGIIAQGKATKSIIIDMKFSTDQKSLIVATARQILFFSFRSKKLQSVRGNFSKHSASIPVSLLAVDGVVLSGMVNSAIYVWEKDTCVRTLTGHKAVVTALCAGKEKGAGFFSGDKNGVVIMWSAKQEIERSWEIPSTLSSNPSITSLSCHKSNLLLGLRSGDIYEFKHDQKSLDQKSTKPLMSGHSQLQLLALCIHPTNGCFYTGGQDRKLMKWKYLKDKKLEKAVTMPNRIRSLDVNRGMDLLAVGCENGVVEFVEAEGLNKAKKVEAIVNFKNPDREVLNLVRFDREGRYLAICYTPPNAVLMLYDMTTSKKVAEVKQTSKIIALDFSKDSKVIQLNTSNRQYFAYTLPDLKRIPTKQLSKLRDQTWHTQTLPMGPGMQSILPPNPNLPQSDLTCCQVSPLGTSTSNRTVLTGDIYSHLKLYPFPNSPVFTKYTGHSSRVTGLRFSEDEKYVVSIGGEEKSILLWKYDSKVVENVYEKDVEEQEGEQAEFDQQEAREQEKREQRMRRNDEYEELGLEVAEVDDGREEGVDEQEGEQAMATNSFKGNILAPTNYEINEARDNQLPKQTLEMSYVFGVRNNYLADQVRNQCRFTSSFDEIVFPTACLGVKMGIKDREQKYFKGHMEDIVSFAVDPRRQIMATGQMAQKNTRNPRKKIVSIHIWDIDTCQLLIKLDGFHTIAVVLLQFSPDSKLLFSCGNDDKNSYAVYSWKTGVILHSGPVNGAKVNGIAWRSDYEFATCGNKHVKFWSKQKGTQGKIPGKNQAMFSICATSNGYVTGSGTGCLYSWVGGVTDKGVPGHRGKVHTLREWREVVYSGADDGVVLAWPVEKSGAVSKYQRIFDTRTAYPKIQMDQNCFGVLSLDLSPDNRILLVTSGCDILLLDSSRTRTPSTLLSGHSKNQLWGLSTSPKTDDLFVTGGDDGTVRVWSIKEKRQVARYLARDRRIRAVDWSKDGQLIVAADNKAEMYLFAVVGGELKMLLKAPFKTEISNAKGKKDSWVEEVKFSPNGKMVVIGAHSVNLFPEIVGVQKDALKTIKNMKFLALDSALLHADWDKASQLLGLNTQSYKLIFSTLSKQASASSCRDIEWSSWTRKIGWPVQGIFQGVDFTDVNSVCSDRENRLLAVGYDDQSIRLFRYPAYIPKQVCKQFHGHSSHVTRVRFNNEYLVSVGGMDKTVIVWEVRGRAGREREKVGGRRRRGDDEEQDYEEEQAADINVVDANVDIPKAAMKQRVEEQPQQDDFQVVEQQGEQFMAIKPWLGSIKQPTSSYPTKGSQSQPAASLTLDYVYGYRTKDCRQNLFYTSQSTCIYHAAAVLIHHNLQSNTQTFMTEHRDDILSIAYHKQKNLVLTGELGAKPLVILSKDTEVLQKFIAPVLKGVLCLAISPEGKLGVCVGMDDYHEVAVVDLRTGEVRMKAKGGRQVILRVAWVNEEEFVTVGIRHYKYWSMEKGVLKGRQAKERLCFVSLAVKDDLILTGAEKDQLMSWRQSSVKQSTILSPDGRPDPDSKTTLNSVVQAITIHDKFIAAGCKNHHIFILSRKSIKQIINVYNMADCLLASQCPSIRSIDILNPQATKLLIGTLASQIYQLTFPSSLYKQGTKRPSNTQTHMQAHYSPNNHWTNQLWGLCTDPKSNKFFTCSDDATVRCWDAQKHIMLSLDSLNYGPVKDGKAKPLQKDQKTKDFSDAAKGRAIALSHERDEIVVGCKNGVVRVYEFSHKTNAMGYRMMFRKATEEISDIKMSVGTMVVGSHDNGIYVYDYEKGRIKERFKALKKHSSYITHMDISRDSANLHSTCGAYELLFWDLNTGKQLTSGATLLRDQPWSTWTTILGWPVQGIWPKCTDGTFYNSVDRSHFTIDGDDQSQSYYLLATGNDLGKVNLFNYPCLEKGAKMIEGKGHSSHVTNVRWTYDDKFVISTGGEDQCVMQWKVEVSRKGGREKGKGKRA